MSELTMDALNTGLDSLLKEILEPTETLQHIEETIDGLFGRSFESSKKPAGVIDFASYKSKK